MDVPHPQDLAPADPDGAAIFDNFRQTFIRPDADDDSAADVVNVHLSGRRSLRYGHRQTPTKG
jgi:hypothetical protein